MKIKFLVALFICSINAETWFERKIRERNKKEMERACHPAYPVCMSGVAGVSCFVAYGLVRQTIVPNVMQFVLTTGVGSFVYLIGEKVQVRCQQELAKLNLQSNDAS